MLIPLDCLLDFSSLKSALKFPLRACHEHFYIGFYVNISFPFSRINARNRLLGYMVKCMFNFKENAKEFSNETVPFYIPISNI